MRHMKCYMRDLLNECICLNFDFGLKEKCEKSRILLTSPLIEEEGGAWYAR